MVKFYEKLEDELLEFAVIISKYQGKWVLCKHKERNTLECPGGHREKGEDIEETAKRELHEETGATAFQLQKVCAYSVEIEDGGIQLGRESYGMLYAATIQTFEKLPEEFEMEKVVFLEQLDGVSWTYPQIQPVLLKKVSGISF